MSHRHRLLVVTVLATLCFASVLHASEKPSIVLIFLDDVIDGKDILDLLLGKSNAASPHKVHFYENEGIRRGKWKLVRLEKKNQLFDLSEDYSEAKDVSNQHPKLVEELNTLLDAHAAEIAANTRPAGFVTPGTARLLISEAGDLPRLRDFLNLPDTTAIVEDFKKKQKTNNGGISK